MISFRQRLFYQAIVTHWIIGCVSPTNKPCPCVVTISTELHIRTYKCPQLQAKYSDLYPEHGPNIAPKCRNLPIVQRCHNKDDHICKNHYPENFEAHMTKIVIHALPVICVNRMGTLSVRSMVPTAVRVTGYLKVEAAISPETLLPSATLHEVILQNTAILTEKRI